MRTSSIGHATLVLVEAKLRRTACVKPPPMGSLRINASSIFCGVALLAVGGAMGCTSARLGAPDASRSDSTENDSRAEDSEPSRDANPDAGIADANVGVSCDPDAAFAPLPWAPPTPFTVACSSSQLAAYNSCYEVATAGFCFSFRNESGNAACLACLESRIGAAAGGPVVTEGQGPTITGVETNWGGCAANLDGVKTSGGCGAKFNVYASCLQNVCGGCAGADAASPSKTSPYYICASAAVSGGSCTDETLTMGCYEEVVACGPQFLDLIERWCGGGVVDSGVVDAPAD
jgi:hypothetical protein